MNMFQLNQIKEIIVPAWKEYVIISIGLSVFILLTYFLQIFTM